MNIAMWSLAAALLVSPLETKAESQSPITFDVAMSAVKANVAAPEGAAYDAALGKEFSARHAGTMIECAADASGEDLTTFVLLMELDATGAVMRSLVRPQNDVSTCLQKAVADEVYRKPPRAGYWVRADMQFKQ